MNSNIKRRIIAFIFAVSMIILLLIFMSCDDDDGDIKNDTRNSETSGDVTLSKTDETDLLADNLGKYDFNGKELRVLVREGHVDHKYEIYVGSDDTGEVINDAVYLRNKTIEDRFNAKISIIAVTESPDEANLTQTLARSVLAGIDEYDLAVGHMNLMGMSTVQDLYLDLYTLPNIDLNKPWWIKEATAAASIAGKSFVAASHMTHTLLDYTYCIYFNKQLARNYAIEDLYTVVNEGRWTLDYLAETVKGMYIDIDNNGKENMADFYGFVTNTQTAANVFARSFDNPVTTHNDEGIPELVLNTQKTADVLEKLYCLFWETPGVFAAYQYTTEDVGWWDVPPVIFQEDRALFCTGTFEYTRNQLRGMETDFGIIPYPKWDEVQENYYTIVDGHGPLIGIPKTVDDIDFVTVMVEALSAEGYKIVTPAYYDVALKVKFVRDEESVQMLDKIIAGVRYDFLDMYDGWGGMANFLQNRLSNKSRNFASYYESLEKTVQARIDGFVDAYLDF